MSEAIPKKSLIILILGSLTALSPFSIDMYLPAFPEIAKDFNTSVASVSLSLSSYFIGLSFGQLLYGPLLDRFGRKKPLCVGLAVYIFSSLGCLFAQSIEVLICIRFLQAIGGCAAGVATMAMVRDLFSTQESAKVLSLLVLILGVSPLLAPTAGGYISTYFGWHSVFIALAVIAALLLITVSTLLPESHKADPSVSLKLGPIFKTFGKILREPQFYTYVFSGAVAFSGLFTYLAGSPIIFMDVFGLSAQIYSWIFAFIAAGLIGCSQLNILLLKKFKNEQVLQFGFFLQVVAAVCLCWLTSLRLIGVVGTVIFLFTILSCLGLTNPNSTALAMAPFGKTAGSASALMGFIQMGIGALASTVVGVLGVREILPIVVVMTSTSTLALFILLIGRRKISRQIIAP